VRDRFSVERYGALVAEAYERTTERRRASLVVR
jgi:hypothetical protein